jgi:hypothetical protein
MHDRFASPLLFSATMPTVTLSTVVALKASSMLTLAHIYIAGAVLSRLPISCQRVKDLVVIVARDFCSLLFDALLEFQAATRLNQATPARPTFLSLQPPCTRVCQHAGGSRTANT